MNYWDISEEFLKIPPCLDQMHVQVAEIEKKKKKGCLIPFLYS